MTYEEKVVREFLGDLVSDLEREACVKSYGHTVDKMNNLAVVDALCKKIDRKLIEKFGAGNGN